MIIVCAALSVCGAIRRTESLFLRIQNRERRRKDQYIERGREGWGCSYANKREQECEMIDERSTRSRWHRWRWSERRR